jgi:hypothetical protein
LNNLQKFYSAFQGVTSRPNKLQEDPASFRKGTQNLRYNFQDELTQSNGFQHKDQGAAVELVDIFEYKYRDVNTGEEKTQILGVGVDGNLYRKKNHTLTFITTGVATSYSVYYDEVALQFKLSMNGISAVTLFLALPLSSLKSSLNAMAGVSVDIVDDDGVTVVSSLLAYQLDCVINNPFEDNSVYYWEVVPYPSTATVAFPTTKDYRTDPEYEGISTINANNSIYITDGSFPMKYDGYTVHRMGMPRFSSDLIPSNVTVTTFNSAYGAATVSSTYKYILQHGYINANGDEVLGQVDETSFLTATTGVADDTIAVNISPVGAQSSSPVPGYQNEGINVFSCSVNGDQTLATNAAAVLNVGNNNIKVGMCLRIVCSNNEGATAPLKGISYFYAKVSASSSTSITFNYVIHRPLQQVTGAPTCPYVLSNDGTATLGFFKSGTVLNASFVPTNIENTITEPYNYLNSQIIGWDPGPLYGAFTRIYRTVANGSTFYKLFDAPVSHVIAYNVGDGLADSDLTTTLNGGLTRLPIDFNSGNELPRACKYLTTWQGQIVQAGRPVRPDVILGTDYPYYYNFAPTSGIKWGGSLITAPWLYQENNLCDFQSAYWADSLSPEGFPQDGLHEFFVGSAFDDKLKGIVENKDALFALKERSTGLLSGDLANNNLQLEILETDAGCISHKSIATVKGTVFWLDEINGFYACVAGRLPENIGYPIADYQKINEDGLDYSSARAVNFQKEDLYICYVGSTAFVFDYSATKSGDRNCWYIWKSDNIDFVSLVATSSDELLGYDGTQTWKLKTTGTDYDYSNHTTAVDFFVKTAWLTQGEPSIDKHFLAIWINSIQGNFTLDVYQYANFLEDQMSVYTGLAFLDESSSKKFIKESVKAAIPKLSSISFGMRNQQINRTVKIQSYEVQLNADFDKGEPKR